MDRRLIVVRHAKAAPADHGPDHARPLTERGRRDARRVAERLVELGWVPQRVLSSDSARTLETWEHMSDRLPAGIPLLPSRRLYNAGIPELKELLSEQPDEVSAVMAVGHNPGWENVVSLLTGNLVAMGTAHAALLLRPLPGWNRAFEPGTWQLVELLRPKEEGL